MMTFISDFTIKTRVNGSPRIMHWNSGLRALPSISKNGKLWRVMAFTGKWWFVSPCTGCGKNCERRGKRRGGKGKGGEDEGGKGRIRVVFERIESLPLPNLSDFLWAWSKDLWEWALRSFSDFSFSLQEPTCLGNCGWLVSLMLGFICRLLFRSWSSVEKCSMGNPDPDLQPSLNAWTEAARHHSLHISQDSRTRHRSVFHASDTPGLLESVPGSLSRIMHGKPSWRRLHLPDQGQGRWPWLPWGPVLFSRSKWVLWLEYKASLKSSFVIMQECSFRDEMIGWEL